MNWYISEHVTNDNEFERMFCNGCNLINRGECPYTFDDKDCPRYETYLEITGILENAEEAVNKVLDGVEEKNTLLGEPIYY